MKEAKTSSNFRAKTRKRILDVRRAVDWPKHAGLIVVLCLVGIYGAFRLLSPRNENAQVRFVEFNKTESPNIDGSDTETLQNPFDGDEYERALRLRECSALGMALSLTVLRKAIGTNQLPNNSAELVERLKAGNLLPPGIQMVNSGIESEHSTFRISFRRDPFAFEVLATPKSNQGTKVLFRFPLPQSEPNSVMYFEASVRQPLPSAFLTIEQLSSFGWKIRHWRGDALTLDAAALDALKEQTDSLIIR